MADILGQNTSQGASVGGPSFEMETQDDRQSLLDAHRRNVSLGLLAAGLGMMATRGSGRHGASFAQKLGEGGLMGLQTYESGEKDAEQELQRRQSSRALNAYRQQEIGVKQAGVSEQERRTDVMKAGQESLAGYRTQEVKNKATEDKNTADYRSAELKLRGGQVGAEQARAGVDVAKFNLDTKPFGASTATSLLKSYGIENADEMGKAIGALPRDDAMKAINTAVIGKKQKLTTGHFVEEGTNKLHVFGLNPDGSKAYEKVFDAPVRQSKGKGGDKTTLADSIKAATGGSPAAAAPDPVPSPATEKIGKRLGLVDSSKYQNGHIYKDKSGKRFIVKDGVMYEAA